MVSSIDETKPEDGVPAYKSELRASLAAAKAEIEVLQARTENTRSITEWMLPTDGNNLGPAMDRLLGNPATVADGFDPIRTDSVSFGKGVSIPEGIFISDRPWEINRALQITGTGINNTQIRFQSCVGAVVHHPNGPSNPRPGANGTQTVLEHMTFQHQGPFTDPNADGFRPEILCHGRDLIISGFPRDGVNNTTDVVAFGNGANICDFQRVRCVSNGRAGWHFEGGDANACTMIQCDASNNDLYGFHDISFLGNFGLGVHASANGDVNDPTTGNYVIEGLSQAGVWIVYEEGYPTSSQTRSRITPPTLAMGRFTILPDNANDLERSLLRFDSSGAIIGGLRAFRLGGAQVELGATDPDQVIAFRDQDDFNNPFQLKKRRVGSYNGKWTMLQNGVDPGAPFAFGDGEFHVGNRLRRGTGVNSYVVHEPAADLASIPSGVTVAVGDRFPLSGSTSSGDPTEGYVTVAGDTGSTATVVGINPIP